MLGGGYYNNRKQRHVRHHPTETSLRVVTGGGVGNPRIPVEPRITGPPVQPGVSRPVRRNALVFEPECCRSTVARPAGINVLRHHRPWEYRSKAYRYVNVQRLWHALTWR